VGGAPVVIKLIEGTPGVVRCWRNQQVCLLKQSSSYCKVQKQNVLIKFVAEKRARTYEPSWWAIDVVAAMRRVAQEDRNFAVMYIGSVAEGYGI
jgi:hypothetical protein